MPTIWSPSWILPRSRNQVKTARNDFFVFDMKNTQISTLHDFIHKIYFYSRKKMKIHVFPIKMA